MAAAPTGPVLPPQAQPTAQGRLGPPSPIPTECLLLKNLFNPAEETEPEWRARTHTRACCPPRCDASRCVTMRHATWRRRRRGRWVDIGEEVKSECSKYGTVRHAFVDKDSQGFVYVKFAETAGAAAAKQALHARWFAGRMIAAEFQFTAVYNQHFPQ